MEQKRELTLTKYNGQPAQIKAIAAVATSLDLDAFVALQARVQAEMPDPSLYVPSTKDELALDLKAQLCIGVWVQSQEAAEKTLVAYMTMRYYGTDAHNYANYFDLAPEELPFWANMDSVVVQSAYRGNGLQQYLFTLAVEWRDPSIIGVGCTISPENNHSLANAKAMGCEVYTRRVMYGKYDRYLLRKKLMPLPGKYRHFKGNYYRVLYVATHSESRQAMVVYQALYGEQGIWVRPAELWFEFVSRDGYAGPRFAYCEP